MSAFSGHISVPALRACPRCGKSRILLNKRSTFGIGYGGHLLCIRCIRREPSWGGEKD